MENTGRFYEIDKLVQDGIIDIDADFHSNR